MIINRPRTHVIGLLFCMKPRQKRKRCFLFLSQYQRELTVSLDTVTNVVSSEFSAHDVTGAVCFVMIFAGDILITEQELMNI